MMDPQSLPGIWPTSISPPQRLMNRRSFLTKCGLASCLPISSENLLANPDSKNAESDLLKGHKIEKVRFLHAKYRYPRLVGRNSKRDINGQHKTVKCVELQTDKGATGWGTAKVWHKKDEEAVTAQVLGKTVNKLITPSSGIHEGLHHGLDIALYDLAGVITNKPVYELLGNKGKKANPIYSGMIYFDELDKDAKPAGLDRVIANCQADYDLGYRQLKVKIGRGAKWYPKAEGLKVDIQVIKMIHEKFSKQGVQILVDANNGYSLQDTIQFFKGIEGIPIYWLEEPFHEDRQASRELKQWMLANGRKDTRYVDGEHQPDLKLVDELLAEKTLDMHLVDIVDYGFSKWVKLMPQLIKYKATASPHTWGSMLKTHYVSHLAAGLGNIATIEGVTCLSDEIDFGDYKIEKGNLHVSDKPGFGMKLLV